MAQEPHFVYSSGLNTPITEGGSTSIGTLTDSKATDDQWDETFKEVCTRLPEKDKEHFLRPQNQEPFTITQMLEHIRPYLQKYTQHGFQRFVSMLDPVLSHINSFTVVINQFVQTHPEFSGLIWGSLYFLITVAGRARDILDKILDFLWRMSPNLALYQKWTRLFPGRDFEDLSKSIQLVYKEVIYFCVDAVRFLKRHPAANFFRVVFSTSMESGFRKSELRISRLTARVKQEVDSAHMHSVHHQLASLGTIIGGLRNPHPTRVNLSGIRIIPHSRNENFFGRSSILQAMDAALQNNSSDHRQRHFALYGLGGSGKTQIALEYTYSRSKHYDTIIWISASSTEKIDQGFMQVAEQLGLEPKFSKNPGQAKDFVRWQLSSSTSEYILVLDNIDDVSLITDILPHGDHGAVITTSRDSIMSENLTRNYHQVLEFSIDEGCEFLRHSLPGYINPNAGTDLRRLSETFHGYPLALGQIAGFIRTNGCSLQDFLKIYEDKKSSSAITSQPVKDYHANLATVWDLSFSSIDEQSKTILEIFAFLDPDSLSYHYFTHGTNEQLAQWPRLRYMTDHLEFLAALRKLRSQSLIRINTGLQTISIHRFFQANVLQQISKDRARLHDSFEEAVHLLTIIQPEFMNQSQHWTPQNWVGSEAYLPHIKALEGHFLKDPSPFRDSASKLARLVYHAAVYLFERNRYKAATDTISNARRILRYSEPLDVLLLSDCYRVEGRIFNESNQPLRTLESSKKAKQYADMAVVSNLMDIHDSRLPRIITGWGNALNQLRQFEKALEMQLEAVKLCRDVPSDKSDAITIVQLNWAYVLLRMGDVESAVRILRATIENDPQSPYAIYPLGNAYLAQNKIDEALAEHVTALNIYISWFGEHHAAVADSLYKIGEIIFLYKGDAGEALPFLSKSSAIYEDQGRHYDNRGARARCARMLGKILEACGKKEEAQGHFTTAWTLREDLTGIRGSAQDVDADYNDLVFYWLH